MQLFRVVRYFLRDFYLEHTQIAQLPRFSPACVMLRTTPSWDGCLVMVSLGGGALDRIDYV